MALFEYTDVAFLVTGSPSMEEWVREGEVILKMRRSWRWWLGDWLLAGEDRYGDLSHQGISEAWSPQTLSNCGWVASRFSPARRREDLSWSHHQEVAKYSKEEQDRWLDLAAQEGWTRARLRRELKLANRESPREEEEWIVVRESELRCICGRKYRFEPSEGDCTNF